MKYEVFTSSIKIFIKRASKKLFTSLFLLFSVFQVQAQSNGKNIFAPADMKVPIQPLAFPIDSSNLPIVYINTNFQLIPNEPKITADMVIVDNGYNVMNHITDTVFTYQKKIGIEKRGSISQLWPQNSYTLETRDSSGNKSNVQLMGMNKEHDWVLYGPYDDHTLMRNALTYKLGRQMGHWAPRTRFCEVILNTFWPTYQGVYLMMEKIKRDNDRVNISKLDSNDVAGDSLTGGYIIAVDKNIWAADSGWTTTNGPPVFIKYVYPSGADIQPQQMNYIRSYVDSFELALLAPNFQSINNGWRKYAEPLSFMDFFFITEMSKNVDAYKRSAYLFKDKYSKGGKLTAGPLWDFNSAWYNVHACGFDSAAGWAYPMTCWVNASFNVPFWWTRMLQDSTFTRDLKCRWITMRSTVLDTNNIFGLIDSMANYVSDGQARHAIQWGFVDSYQGQVDTLKWWIRNRLAWMDANMPGNCWNLGVGDDNSMSDDFTVFPNPTSGDATMNFYLSASKTLGITVCDITGRQILDLGTKEYFAGHVNIPIDLETFAPGTYFVRLSSGTSYGVKKLVKIE